MWKKYGVASRPQMTVWCMRFACSLNKAIDTHSEYIILVAFPVISGYANTQPSVRSITFLWKLCR